MPDEPFFRLTDQGYEPNPVCRGPWGPATLHGRVVAGLLAREAEQMWGAEGMRVGRLTVDLYRMPVFEPVHLRSTLVRETRRIKIVDTEFVNGGKPAGRASVVFLKESENADGDVWGPPPWDAPGPETVPAPPPPEGRGDWKPMWDMRTIEGGFDSYGQKRCWIREVRPLVEGEELTPLQRVALAADLASPLTNSGSNGLHYLNTDITLYLHRYPTTEWIGFETGGHHASDGIAVATCMLYDEEGTIGRSTVAAIANRRQG